MPTSRSGALCAGSCGARVCCSVSGADGKAGPDCRKLACADAAGFPGSAAGAVAAVAGFSGAPAWTRRRAGGKPAGYGRYRADEGRSRTGAAGATGRGDRRAQGGAGNARRGCALAQRGPRGRIRNHHRLKGASSCFCASVSTGCRGSGAASATGPAPLCGPPACAGGVTCPSRGLSSLTSEKSALGSTLEGALCAAESRSPSVSPRMASLTSVRTASGHGRVRSGSAPPAC